MIRQVKKALLMGEFRCTGQLPQVRSVADSLSLGEISLNRPFCYVVYTRVFLGLNPFCR